jgi:hypothetical protein
MRRSQRHADGGRRRIGAGRFMPPPASSKWFGMKPPDENHWRVDVIFEILVDFCFRNALAVTLVSQLAKIDHHFFLDFIFH